MKVFLLIFGALVLLLLCPVRLTLHWKNDLSVTAQWLFFRFGLLPQSPKKKSKPQAPASSAKPAAAAPQSAAPGLVDTITQYADRLIDDMKRHIKELDKRKEPTDTWLILNKSQKIKDRGFSHNK